MKEKNQEFFKYFPVNKAERLTTAIYLLTEYFDDRESLKWKLRSRCASFMSLINVISFSAGSRNIARKSEAYMRDILSLLKIGVTAHLISPMNFSILNDEFIFLISFFRREWGTAEPFTAFEFPEKFFSKNEDSYPYDTPGAADKQSKDKNGTDPDYLKDIEGHARFSIENKSFYKDISSSYKKKLRRDSIIKIIRAKGEITIKDISYLMSGVSEKTIQRELAALVVEGVLSREGKRRWSKYALKYEQD